MSFQVSLTSDEDGKSLQSNRIMYRRSQLFPSFVLQVTHSNPATTSNLIFRSRYRLSGNIFRFRTLSSTNTSGTSNAIIPAQKIWQNVSTGVYNICLASTGQNVVFYTQFIPNQASLHFQNAPDDNIRFFVRRVEDVNNKPTYTIQDCLTGLYITIPTGYYPYQSTNGAEPQLWTFDKLDDTRVAIVHVDKQVAINAQLYDFKSLDMTNIADAAFYMIPETTKPLLKEGVYLIKGYDGNFCTRNNDNSISYKSWINSEISNFQFRVRNVSFDLVMFETINSSMNFVSLVDNNSKIIMKLWNQSTSYEMYWKVTRDNLGRFQIFQKLSNQWATFYFYVTASSNTITPVTVFGESSDPTISARWFTFHPYLPEGIYTLRHVQSSKFVSLQANGIFETNGPDTYNLLSRNSPNNNNDNNNTYYMNQRFYLRYAPGKTAYTYIIQDCYSGKYVNSVNGVICAGTNADTEWQFRAVSDGLLLVNGTQQCYGFDISSSTIRVIENGQEQTFVVEADTSTIDLDNGIYYIAGFSNNVLQVSKNNNSTLQYQPSGYALDLLIQKFHIRNLGNNVITIQVKDDISGSRFLCASSLQGDISPVQWMAIDELHPATGFYWKLTRDSIGRFKIYNFLSGLFLAVDETKQNNLTQIQDAVADSAFWTFHTPLADGVYSLRYTLDSRCVTLFQNNISEDDSIPDTYCILPQNQADAMEHFNQRFLLESVPGKEGVLFTIRDCYSEKYLTTYYNIICGKSKSIDSEWKFHAVKGGFFMINNTARSLFGMTSMESSNLSAVDIGQTIALDANTIIPSVPNGMYEIQSIFTFLALTAFNFSDDISIKSTMTNGSIGQKIYIRNLGFDIVTIQMILNGKDGFVSVEADSHLLYQKQWSIERSLLWKLLPKDNYGTFKIQNLLIQEVISANESSVLTSVESANDMAQEFFFNAIIETGEYNIFSSSTNNILKQTATKLIGPLLYDFYSQTDATAVYFNQRFSIKPSVQHSNRFTIHDYFTKSVLPVSNTLTAQTDLIFKFTVCNGGYHIATDLLNAHPLISMPSNGILGLTEYYYDENVMNVYLKKDTSIPTLANRTIGVIAKDSGYDDIRCWNAGGGGNIFNGEEIIWLIPTDAKFTDANTKFQVYAVCDNFVAFKAMNSNLFLRVDAETEWICKQYPWDSNKLQSYLFRQEFVSPDYCRFILPNGRVLGHYFDDSYTYGEQVNYLRASLPLNSDKEQWSLTYLK